MGTHIGNEGTVKIGSNTLAEVRSWSLQTSVQMVDDSEMSDAWDSHVAGSKSWQGNLTCSWDETDTNGQAALVEGASATLNLYPEGASSGDAYFTGTVTITGVQYQGSRNGLVEAAFTFQGNGALSRTTVAP